MDTPLQGLAVPDLLGQKWKLDPSEILKSSFQFGMVRKGSTFQQFLTMTHMENNHLSDTYFKKKLDKTLAARGVWPRGSNGPGPCVPYVLPSR